VAFRSWLSRVFARLPSRRTGCISRPDHVGFVVSTVALRHIFPNFFTIALSVSIHRCSLSVLLFTPMLCNLTDLQHTRSDIVNTLTFLQPPTVLCR
jgi:hypothetical protein